MERFERLFKEYRNWVLGGAGLIVAVLVVLLGTRGSDPARRPALEPRAVVTKPYRPVFVGFYENPGSSTPQGSWPSFKAHAGQIQIVSPYWYRIDGGGALSQDMSDPKVTAFAHAHHVRVWPLIGNTGSSPISSTADLRGAADRIVALVQKNGYDGAFVDFELIPPWTRDNLSTFLHRLGSGLHKLHKGVGVAVFPKVNVDPTITTAYDYPALGGVTDMVVVMAYDRHQGASGAGPVAPLPWVKKNVAFALRTMAPSKVYLGIAAYGYDWTAPGSGSTVSTRQVNAVIAQHGASPVWSDPYGEPHFNYQAGGQQHTVWYEDTATFLQKLALARKQRLGGIALWRVGFEEPSLWTQMQRHLG